MSLKQVAEVILVLSLVAGTGCGRKPASPSEVIGMKGAKDAKSEAQESFEAFRARVQAPQDGDRGFQVKVEVKDENGTEMIWLNELKLESEPYSGIVASEPAVVKNIAWKDTYTFSKDDVCDWMYWAGTTVQGNHMARAALESMPPDEAARMREKMGW